MPFIEIHSDVPKFAQRFTAAPGEMNRILAAAGKETVQEAQRMFQATTRTWTHQPDFKSHVAVGGGRVTVNVSTDDEIYRYVTEGTRPHLIVPRKARILAFHSGYRTKTTPGLFTSHAGGPFGLMVFTRAVHHPGTKPRKFMENIEKRMDAISQQVLNRHIREWAEKLA